MFHAVVRSGRDAFHFIAEINGYNLETLQQHVRGTFQDRGTAALYVEVDPSEQVAWEKQTRRWLSRLARSGIRVQIETGPSQTKPSRQSPNTTRPAPIIPRAA